MWSYLFGYFTVQTFATVLRLHFDATSRDTIYLAISVDLHQSSFLVNQIYGMRHSSSSRYGWFLYLFVTALNLI
jgi:hypothetical protein